MLLGKSSTGPEQLMESPLTCTCGLASWALGPEFAILCSGLGCSRRRKSCSRMAMLGFEVEVWLDSCVYNQLTSHSTFRQCSCVW